MDVDLSPKYIAHLSDLRSNGEAPIEDISDSRNGLLMMVLCHKRFDLQDFAFLQVRLFLAMLNVPLTFSPDTKFCP